MLGIRDLAKATGFSTATVSRALRNDPSVLAETRAKILRKVAELGYETNPYVGQLMSSLRRRNGSQFKGNLALVWLDKRSAKDADHRIFQIQRGAMERAQELGYSLNEFDRLEQSPEALRKILWSRGIRGILIASPSFSLDKSYFRFDLKNFAAVSLGWGLIHPQLDNIRFDYYQAVRLALHHARHAYRKGVAAIWNFKTDRRAQHAVRASFLTHHPGGPVLAQKLFLDFKRLMPKQTEALFAKHGIECVIVESAITLPSWFQKIVPEKNRIWLKNPAPAGAFGWIDTQNHLMGRWGIDLLSAKLMHNEYGVPENSQVVLVPPRWMRGKAG